MEQKRIEEEEVTEREAEMIMEGLQQLGKMIVEQGNVTNQHIQHLAEIMAAPTEVIRDGQGRASGSRKVFENQTIQ